MTSAAAIDAIDRDRQRLGPAKHVAEHSIDLIEMRKMSHHGLPNSWNSLVGDLPCGREVLQLSRWPSYVMCGAPVLENEPVEAALRARCSIYTYGFRMALQEGAHPPVRNGTGSAQRAYLRKRCISLDAQLLPLSSIRHSMPVDGGYSKHVLRRIACTLASLGGRTSTWPSDCSLSHTCHTLSFGGKAQVTGSVDRSRCSHAGPDIWVPAAPEFLLRPYG